MSSIPSLRAWVGQLLPHARRCGQEAARELLLALFFNFTTCLAQLGRQTDRESTDESARRYLARWLDRPHWEPQAIYAALLRQAAPLLWHGGDVLLWVDFTDLEKVWNVLEIALPWQGRALPLYRAVVHYTEPEEAREPLLRSALAFVAEHLPIPPKQVVWVMDRGFPGHWLVRALQEGGWRYVIRLTSRWKVEHSAYTGPLSEAPRVEGLVGSEPRLLAGAVLGRRGKGRNEWSVSNVVLYHGNDEPEPWYLVTSEGEATAAVAIYDRRPQIDCEFRDVKGPCGLDRLARWEGRERVARFLAIVAMYEWRLAWLWWKHQLPRLAREFTKYGPLAWFRLAQEWIQRRLRLAARSALDCV